MRDKFAFPCTQNMLGHRRKEREGEGKARHTGVLRLHVPIR